MTKHFILDKLIIMNNSIIIAKMTKVIRWWPIGSGVLVLCFFVFQTAGRDLTSLESVLLQIISLAIGCGVSFWVGQQSNRKAAEDILKPHARNAVRYLISLSKSISRTKAIASVGLPQQLELHEDYHFIRGALIATFTEQLVTTDDAIENWHDILKEELEDLIQKLREESITPEKLEDFIQKLTYDNTTEDK